MAISSSNRSPSPISGKTNPNIRTPESNPRKSFERPSISSIPRVFNPAAPPNSPADFPRRNSISKEGIRTSYEQKENEIDRNCLKPIRVSSSSKGTKNFMSPTISAASKMNRSPKKKVLAERNEAIRTSVSYSAGKFSFTSINQLESSEIEEVGSKSQMGIDSEVLSNNPKISNAPSEPKFGDSDVEDQLGLTSKPSVASTDLAPLDIDPSLPRYDPKTSPDTNPSFRDPLHDIDPSIPPYDPKTNYLSPRPQFLRYKPNRRIEIYLSKQKDFDSREGTRLEDSFSSENCSDTEPSEETQSSNPKNDFNEVEIADDEEPRVYDPPSDTNNTQNQNSIEESIGVKQIPKSCSFARSKFVPIMLVLLVTSLSITVTDSPLLLSSSVIKDPWFTKLYEPAAQILTHPYVRDQLAEVADFANANFEWLAYNFRHWSVNSFSYFSKVNSFSRGELEFQFANLTATENDSIGKEEVIAVVSQEKESMEHENEGEATHEKAKEKEFKAEEKILKEEKEEYDDKVLREEQILTSYAVEIVPEVEEVVKIEEKGKIDSLENELQDVEVEELVKIQEKGKIDSLEIELQDVEVEGLQSEEKIQKEEMEEYNTNASVEIHPQRAKVKEIQEKVITDSGTNIQPGHVEITSQDSKSDTNDDTHDPTAIDTLHLGPEDKSAVENVLGISSVLLTLAVAFVAYLCLQKKEVSIPEAKIPKQHLSQKKMIVSNSVSGSSESHLHFERSSFHQNWPAEVEMVGESGPLEMEMSSSLQKSSSSSSRQLSMKGTGEFQSNEKKLRKSSNMEFIVSSSEYSAGSPSYGSFTTYEKVHNKQGCGGDDVVTPVRRSSRIRKQITSP
ncbi:uncharacterized protein LOC143876173 [Tasmannia lanceolata]|uniref:uncharacterized protein LOC143876173 n=1 Tax=Tasmannia lanceolata TaxID=3420 RepID=UPI004063D1B4